VCVCVCVCACLCVCVCVCVCVYRAYVSASVREFRVAKSNESTIILSPQKSFVYPHKSPVYTQKSPIYPHKSRHILKKPWISTKEPCKSAVADRQALWQIFRVFCPFDLICGNTGQKSHVYMYRRIFLPKSPAYLWQIFNRGL